MMVLILLQVVFDAGKYVKTQKKTNKKENQPQTNVFLCIVLVFQETLEYKIMVVYEPFILCYYYQIRLLSHV